MHNRFAQLLCVCLPTLIAQSDGLRRSVICFMGNLQLHANAAWIFLAQPSVRASCISVFPSPVSNERSFS